MRPARHVRYEKRGTVKQTERRLCLIQRLIQEMPQYQQVGIPADTTGQKRLLRSLMNVRPPMPVGEDFLAVQDEYLQTEMDEKGITDISELKPVEDGIYLWQGDITTLRCAAIVNAANSGMTGCYVPCHGCIDNAVHTYAGVQLRLECARLMERQGHDEETGKAKITPAYNLPCDYILHTVGPIVCGKVTENDEKQLASCYRSCLTLSAQKGIQSVAFCCISTGEFHFPNRRAAQIAVQTVQRFRGNTEVIFNVFKDIDYKIYRDLLG